MTEREKLEQEAAEAMKAAGRIPETAILAVLPDETLRAVVDYFTGPRFVG